MKALRFHEFGGPDVYRLDDDVAVPEPGEGEILVQVSGAGLNPMDWKIRGGTLKEVFPVELPRIAGWEFSGTVAELGAGVTAFSVGDEVYGFTNVGAMAEYTVASAGAVALKPFSMDLPDSAAVPIAAVTAWQVLFDAADLQAGQRVLIQAASGGVGSFAVQFAKWKGAYVIGTASAKNHHFVRELGADEVIDYRTTPYETAVSDVDVVLESIGGANMPKSLAVLKPGGILVSISTPPPVEEAEAQGKRAVFLSARADTAYLTKIAGLIQDLQIRPVVDAVVPFSEAIEAYKEAEEGHTVGKIVVDVRR